MSPDTPALLQAAARYAGRVGDQAWRPDQSDDQALELARQMNALVSFDFEANLTTIVHTASGQSVSESTVGDRAAAMRLAILRLAASLAPLN